MIREIKGMQKRPGHDRSVLVLLEAAAAEMVERFREADADTVAQPGRVMYPKKIFVTEEGSPPVPDGCSLEYLLLVRELWRQAWSREAVGEPTAFVATNVRLVQNTIIEAHVLERRIMALLETAR